MVLTQEIVTKYLMDYLKSHNETYKNPTIQTDKDGDVVIIAQYKDTVIYLSRGHSIPYIHAIVPIMELPNDSSTQLDVLKIINTLNSTISCCRTYSSSGRVYVGVFIHVSSAENLDKFVGMCLTSIDYAFDKFNSLMEKNALED